METRNTYPIVEGIDAPAPVKPAPVRFHEWHTKPDEWSARFVEQDMGKAYGALRSLLENPATDFVRCALPLATLLASVRASISYRWDREDSRFVSFGPIVVPTSPRGLDALRAIRAHASEALTGTSPRAVLDDSSATARLLDEIKRVSGFRSSGILQGIKNRTSSASEVSGIRIGFDFDSRALASMPKGLTLPPALLGTTLVGREITGDEAQELRSDLDMCADGTAEFLRTFGISHECDGGEYECDSCGSVSESDEGGDVSYIADFTLTAEMVEALDRQGYGDGFREHFGAEDGCDEWSSMLETCDDSEILERCAPNTEDGIAYDSDVWDFVPDFEGIAGLDDLEWSEQARALPLLVRIAQAHETARVLPPISGALVLKPAPYETRSTVEPKRFDFVWSPDEGTLTHEIGGALVLRVSAKNGAVSIGHTLDGAQRFGALAPAGSEYALDAPAHEGGERSAMLLGILKGSAGI